MFIFFIFISIFSFMINTNIITKEAVCKIVNKDKLKDPYLIAEKIVVDYPTLSFDERTSYAEAVLVYINQCEEKTSAAGSQTGKSTSTKGDSVVIETKESPYENYFIDYIKYNDFGCQGKDIKPTIKISENYDKICSFLEKNKIAKDKKLKKQEKITYEDFLKTLQIESLDKINKTRGNTKEFFMDDYGKNNLIYFSLQCFSEKDSSKNIGECIAERLMRRYGYSYSSGNFLKASLITKNFAMSIYPSCDDDYFDNDKILEIIERVNKVSDSLKINDSECITMLEKDYTDKTKAIFKYVKEYK